MKISLLKTRKNYTVLYVGINGIFRMYVVLNGGQNFVSGKESFCDLESVT
jgi:hypothetical protein